MRKNVGSPLAGRVSSNFGGSVNHRTKKIIAGLLIATIGPLVATTLAASVTIGNGGNLEFGQGSQAAVACDTSITTAITEAWHQAGTYFRVATIVLKDFNSAVGAGVSDAGCGGKVLKISLLGSDGTALAIGTSGITTSSSVTITSTTEATPEVNGTTATLSGTTLTLTVIANLDASTVYRVAVETS